MAKSYYSTVFDEPADVVWRLIRDFNAYPVWVDGAGTSEIEDGKSGDTVGAVRHVVYQGRHIRPRLLAQSDVERESMPSRKRARCRSRTTAPPFASRRSSMAIALLWNGGRRSIAASRSSKNARRSLQNLSPAGWSRCAARW
jgi:hypothetical protein